MSNDAKKKNAKKAMAPPTQRNLLNTAEDLAKQTHFSKRETVRLLGLYSGLARPVIDGTKFDEFLYNQFNIIDDVMRQRVFTLFKTFDNTDKDKAKSKISDNIVTLTGWIRGLSVVLRGSLDEQSQFCFNVYDLNSTGFITRDNMYTMLKNSIANKHADDDPVEVINDLVSLALKLLVKKSNTADGDYRCSYESFREAIRCGSHMMQLFGACLPDDQFVQAFESMYLKTR